MSFFRNNPVLPRVRLAILGGCVVLALFIVYTGRTKHPLLPSSEFASYRSFTSKTPFHILVDKGFPEKASSLFITDHSPAVFALDQMKGGKTDAKLSVGTLLSVRVVLDENSQPTQIWILSRLPNQPEQLFQDLDLNGTWDVKTLLKENTRFIELDGGWLEVTRISGLAESRITAEAEDSGYLFDATSGRWRKVEGR